MADPQVPVELDPRFQTLSPEEQATVRTAWQAKMAAVSPEDQKTIWTAWRQKYPAPTPQAKPMLDERGQPMVTGALPPGAVEDVEQTIPAPRKRSIVEGISDVANQPASPELVKAAQGIKNPVLGGAAELGASALTPGNMALAALIASNPELVAPAGLAFGIPMLWHSIKATPDAWKAWQQGDHATALRIATKAVISAGLAYLGGREGVSEVAGAVKPTPLTVSAEDLSPLDIPTVMRKGPPAVPPRQAPAPPPGGLESLELPPNAPSPAQAALNIHPTPEEIAANEKALQSIELGEEPPITPQPVPGGRGPLAPTEPSEQVQPLEYPGPAGELRQEEFTPPPREPGETIPIDETLTPEQVPSPRQAGPAQDEFHQLPTNLSGEPEPGIEAELARQEAVLEGQEKAVETLRREMPDSEAADAIEQQAAETKAKLGDLRAMWERTKAMREPPTVKNPPASPLMEKALRDELYMRGIDPGDPQAVAEEIARDAGLKKPFQVTTVGTYPVSKTTETPTRYEADIAENKPSTVLHEGQHPAETEGTRGPVPEGPGANDQIVADYLAKNNLSARTTEANVALQKAAEDVENSQQQRDIAFSRAQEIGETGTFGDRALRAEFREAGPKPETANVGVSENEVRTLNKQFQLSVDALQRQVQEAQNVAREVGSMSDYKSRSAATAAFENADWILRQLKVARRAAGKTLAAFQLPGEILQRARELGLTVEELKQVKLRQPILNEMADSIRDWRNGDISQKEMWKILGRDAVDGFRLNLFTPFSFMLHIAMSDIPFQMAGAAGADLFRVAGGDFSLPAMRGWVYALADRIPNLVGQGEWLGKMDPRIAEAIGDKTASGEMVRGGFAGKRGTFLWRQGPISSAVDYAMGSPLYAKVALDRAAGNLAAEATLWERALEQTPDNLSGEAARQWRRDFVNHAPDDVLSEAIDNAKKAKFNRDLSKFEERVGGSTTYRLLVDVFSRWPFQATRAMGEWLGYDPSFFSKLKNEGFKMDGDELGRYLVKSATGLGGLTLLNSLVYDNVDSRSMQYVHYNDQGQETGRTRLVEPIPAAIVLLGSLRAIANAGKGDFDQASVDLQKAHSALQYASLPFAKLVGALTNGGELGGVLSVLTSWVRHGGGDRNQPLDPNGLKRSFEDQVNRLMPGQGILGALKYILDPVERQGIGARLPWISEATEQVPNRTQGGPVIRTRELPLGAGDAVLSANMPWSTEKEDPVKALLMRYGEPVYRGPRTPIAGVPPSALPDNLLNDYEEELGLARQRILGPLAYRMALQGNDLEKLGDEKARAIVRRLDSVAAAQAVKAVTARHAPEPKPFRRETLQEILGPSRLHAGYTLSKQTREEAQQEQAP